jgi:glucose-6-phosphate isomerase
MQSTDQLPAWQKLIAHHREMEGVPMRDLFAKDAKRFDTFSLEAPGLFFDYSKNRISEKTLDLLCELVDEANLSGKIESLFKGDVVNRSENRPAWHTILRDPKNAPLEVQHELEKMRVFCEQQAHITDIVNIGIGGSELGPAMIYHAFKKVKQTPECHFIASYDLPYLEDLLAHLNPKTTLFLVVSKTFSTAETLANADVVKKYLKNDYQNLIAVTAKPAAAIEYGISEKNIFSFWDWVGGRYSLWSAVGFSIALVFGFPVFKQLLEGAHAMDEHFRHAKFSKNMPVILGLLGVWYQNFFGAQSQVIIPYSRPLKFLSDYLQQLQMESLGKRVDENGRPMNVSTGAILWGGIGTNSQHSFHQLLMQGTQLAPIDFILPLQKNPDLHFLQLAAHCIGQSKTLLEGYTADQIRAEGTIENLVNQKIIPGNYPSNTILLEELNPFTLGALLAAYEHKVFVQSVIWQINAFDQWGVERGKVLAAQIATQIQTKEIAPNNDSSTRGLLGRL